MLSFDAHYLLVTIHPWVDGNGRMSRLVMNHLSAPINQRLFRLIQENSDWTYLRYAEELGVSEATVKRRIGELKKAGFIRRVGSNKTGHWIV